MFHLFNRVYVVPEQFDTADCRVGVISKSSVEALPLKFQKNQVLFYATDWTSLFQSSNELTGLDEVFRLIKKDKNEKIFLVCDSQALKDVVCAWLKILLKNGTDETIQAIWRSYLFRYEVFYKNFNERTESSVSFFNLDADFTHSTSLSTAVQFTSESWKDFCGPDEISVEFLLADYLYEKNHVQGLKQSVYRLLKKDLEKYLYELKEIMLVHLLQKRFISQFRLKHDYTLFDFQNIIHESNPSIQVFFESKIWNTPGMARHTSGKNISFDAIEPHHIEAMKQFNEFAAGEWGEEGIYRYVKSDVSKLDFIQFLQNKDDMGLQKLIEVESQFTNAAGSFFSIDLSSVNHYLINHIFNMHNQNNKEQLSLFILK